jgi:type I restriction enzyme, S subunit
MMVMLMSNVPKLRFKEFSGNWEEKPLGKYGKLVNGLTYSPDNIVENGLLVLRSSNIQNGQIAFEDNVYVDLDVAKEYLTQENDILICVRNGSKRLIGKSLLIPKNLPKSTHGAFMTVFRGDSNKFISHWLKTPMFFKEVHKNLGATINSINGSNLKKFKTFFPKKQEQEKIASFLTSVDTKIEQLTKKEQLLEQYKKGVKQKIFSQEIRFKDDDGSEFKEWEEKKLKEVTSKKSSNISANTLEENIGQCKVYGATGHLKNVNFYTEDKPYISIVKDGAGVGRVLLCDAKSSVLGTLDIIHNNHNINLYFIYLLLSRIHFEKYIVGSTIPHIYYKDYSNEKIQIPCIKEQNKIASFLSAIDTKITTTQKQLNLTKEFKKALLQQMFV